MNENIKLFLSFLLTFCLLLFFGCQSVMNEGSKEEDPVDSATGNGYYIVGYETCGLTIQDGVGYAKGYIVISESLKDTLTVYNLPKDIYIFPVEIFTIPLREMKNMAFPEQYRYSFKIQLEYSLSTEEELYNLGLKEWCPIRDILVETYKNCIPVICKTVKNE